MIDGFFVIGLGAVLALYLDWAFRHLPGERWQMLAVVPTSKSRENSWKGTTLSSYGFFIATSQILALILLVVLLGAMHVSIAGALLTVLIVLTICVPAARMVARAVEKKGHTFTTGGASFIGILLAPIVVLTIQRLLVDKGYFLPVIPVLAAMAIAYTLGEGLGRLGCISFGCCYGRPVKDCNRLLQRLFNDNNFNFQGAAKKAACQGRLAGEKLIPLQAITCVVYTCGALVGCLLFLYGHFTEALRLTVMLTQLWRLLSESLRADFRGFGRISVYQKMGVMGVLYMLLVTSFIAAPQQYIDPDVVNGLKVLWDPMVILTLQFLWLVLFLVFGRSTVTTSTVSFYLIRKHI